MNHDATVTCYFEAAGDLLGAVLQTIKTGNPTTYKALSDAIAAGATMTLSSTVGAAKVVEVCCTLNAGDESVSLFRLDGRSQTAH